ncbi:MAG: aminotransferase class I/II-fold pyridoxal phosphate-dependent enzyme [Lachnospiraceae bacterium]
MKSFQEMTKEELQNEKVQLTAEYENYKKKGLKLDMSRGKPSPAQLDLSMDMLDVLDSKSELKAEDGADVRNYGILDGIPEAKKLMAEVMGVTPEMVIIFGNASLCIMYDTICRAYTHGILGSTPWCRQEKIKFLCPVPGYDRHFKITEQFGFEMINVPMTENGPDMDVVEEYVNKDPQVKGIWCVPKYSNPQGISYSDETVKRFARLKPAAEDFRIFWDNAYVVHHLYEDHRDELLNIFEECKKTGNENLVYEFCSTSKITFPGSGISAFAASQENIAATKKLMGAQTISHDKINQLRHVRYFKDAAGIEAHMKKHANLLRPKFDMLLELFQEKLEGAGAGSWYRPNGGYFITYEANEGCAKRIVSMAKEAGMAMTGAGAPFPYGKDPKDSVIRIAPSFPTLEELRTAGELFVVCVKLASVEQLLEA